MSLREESVALLKAQMRSEDPSPETMKLFKKVWATLPSEERRDLLAAIGQAPTGEEVHAWQEDTELHRRLLRQWRWLAGVADDLQDPWGTAYAELVQEFGEGSQTARRFGAAYTGSTPPLSPEEIAELGPEGFSEWLASWTPPPGRWNVPTPRGLARELAQAVQTSPQPWVAALPELLGSLHHPTYIRGLLEGIREAAKQGSISDWTRVLSAIELVASEPWSVEPLGEDPFESDPNWTDSQRESLSIMQEAADRDSDFPPDLLERIWDVLATLLRRRGDGSAVSGPDHLTPAINKTSTIALRAMFSLTLSVSRRHLDLGPWRNRLAGAVTEELEIDSERPLATAIVASLFPQFVYVVGAPAMNFIPTLFGDPETNTVSAEAIETLVQFARPITNEMLLALRRHILAYLLGPASDQATEGEREAVRWLVIGYIRQLEGQQSATELIESLSHPRRISEAAEFFGRVLKETPEPTTELLEGGLRFWDEALADSALPSEAFCGFGWWSEATTIDDDVWLERILATLQRTGGSIDWGDEVAQRLARLRDQPGAWEALALLVRGAPDRWTVSYWARNLQELFEQTSADDPLGALRSALAERLVERELMDFRRFTE